MKILFDSKEAAHPRLSIIAADWPRRESRRLLESLSGQTIARQDYEVIWVEYHGERAPWVQAGIDGRAAGARPPVDRWIVMEVPDGVGCHRHLMYNVGIIAALGGIVAFCAPDDAVRPDFAESIIEAFDRKKGIVVNAGETKGRRGACMAALRDDLIAIGGADEHIDYIGVAGGPYEMAFRLVNAGKREVRLGNGLVCRGVEDPAAPDEGRGASPTALAVRRAGRIAPLVENPAMGKLRLKQDDIIYEPLLNQAVPSEEFKHWAVGQAFVEKAGADVNAGVWGLNGFKRHPFVNAWLAATFLKILVRQFYMKLTKFSRRSCSGRDLLRKFYRIYDFFMKMGHYNNDAFQRCGQCLKRLASANAGNCALYGTGEVAEIIYKMTFSEQVKINAVFDGSAGGRLFDMDIQPLERIRDYRDRVIVASLIGVDGKVEALRKSGVEMDRIVVL